MAASRRGPSGPPPLTVRIDIDGAQETLKAFRDLPKDASDELRAAALDLSEHLAAKIRAAGAGRGGQAAALAATVKAKRDRVPNLVVGGTTRIARGRRDGTAREAYQLLFGSEFGHSGQGGRGAGSGDKAPHGFGARSSPAGTWIFPTVRAEEAEISRRWNEAADDIVARFTAGGGS